MHVAAYFLPKNDPILPKIFLVNWHCPGSILTKFDHRLLLERLGTKIPKIPKFYLCSDMADFHRVAFSHVRCEKYFKNYPLHNVVSVIKWCISSIMGQFCPKIESMHILIKNDLFESLVNIVLHTEEMHHLITDTILCNG